ncbi:MAG: hypothetical protein C5B49_15425 [Bdellovibrio sp.]|nr:MAG: hypothetical protein C5B49_15425 [Bdellovibrio sp.]
MSLSFLMMGLIVVTEFQNCGRASLSTVGSPSTGEVPSNAARPAAAGAGAGAGSVDVAVASPMASPLATVTPSAAAPVPAALANTSCPVGQYISAVQDNSLSCRTILPVSGSSVSCPDRQVLIGLESNGQAACQQLMVVPLPDASCPAGQVLVGFNQGVVECSNPPPVDFSNYCRDGNYLPSLALQAVTCSALPMAGMISSLSCLPGTFLSGIQANAAVCSDGTTKNQVNLICRRGYYPAGFSQGVLVCNSIDGKL